MSDNKETGMVYSGLTFSGLLTIVFVALKLIGVIKWSWLWVLAPLWITWIPALLILLYFLVIIALASREDRKNGK